MTSSRRRLFSSCLGLMASQESRLSSSHDYVRSAPNWLHHSCKWMEAARQLLALTGGSRMSAFVPLLGDKRTHPGYRRNDVNDPERPLLAKGSTARLDQINLQIGGSVRHLCRRYSKHSYPRSPVAATTRAYSARKSSSFLLLPTSDTGQRQRTA